MFDLTHAIALPLQAMLAGLILFAFIACQQSPAQSPSTPSPTAISASTSTPSPVPTPTTIPTPVATSSATAVPVQTAAPVTQGIEGKMMVHGPGIIMDCSQFPEGQEQEDCEASNKPFSNPIEGSLVEIRTDGNVPVASMTTRADGSYRFELSPGDYLVCSTSCEGPITVMAGEFTTYEIALYVP